MTAYSDALDLQTAVVEHVGSVEAVPIFPQMVKLAESLFNNRLRCWRQITSTTVTSTDGTAAFPADFLEVVGLYDLQGYELVAQPTQNDRITNLHRSFYSVGGSGATTEGQTGTYTLEYYAAIPSISDGMGASNWLLQQHPHLYLYGVGLEAAKNLATRAGGDESQRLGAIASATLPLLEEQFDAVQQRDSAARYSRARVRVGGPTP